MRLRSLIAFCLMSGIALWPQSPNGLDVEGVRGHIEVVTVKDRSATFIQVKPEDRRNPLVFVLQYGEKTRTLPEWSGNGTFYLGNGLVAFSGQDGTRRIAKFREPPVPASLQKFSMESFEIVGIGRYGESSPLTDQEIMNLRAYGVCSLTASGAEARQGAALLQVGDCRGFQCDSDGEGATSCSMSGDRCSVTCSTGYYACCRVTHNNCKCCKSVR